MPCQPPRGLSIEASAALAKLEKFFMSRPAFLIAYSGGMDSSFLALAAKKYKTAAYRAILVNSPFISAEEVQIARHTATTHHLSYEEISFNPLLADEVAQNDPQRCYHCKKHIFKQLLELVRPEETICEGSVIDDETDYRPGKQAIKELKICSPLHECGFSKAIIAEILTAEGTTGVVRPGQSCLATRIATGTPITSAALEQIAAGEEMLRLAGLSFFRLRHHGNLARLEVTPGQRHRALDIAAALAEDFAKIGFKHVCIDITGYRRGSMNR